MGLFPVSLKLYEVRNTRMDIGLPPRCDPICLSRLMNEGTVSETANQGETTAQLHPRPWRLMKGDDTKDQLGGQVLRLHRDGIGFSNDHGSISTVLWAVSLDVQCTISLHLGSKRAGQLVLRSLPTGC